MLRDDELLLAEIYTDHPDYPDWNSRIGIYLRSNENGLEVVGVERQSFPHTEEHESPSSGR